MNIALLLVLSAVLALTWLILRLEREHAAYVKTRFTIVESALGDITGRQQQLEREYKEVHGILKQIRDLNSAELQDRKEILQRQSITSNRVTETRRLIADLEEAARKELDGLRGGGG